MFLSLFLCVFVCVFVCFCVFFCRFLFVSVCFCVFVASLCKTRTNAFCSSFTQGFAKPLYLPLQIFALFKTVLVFGLLGKNPIENQTVIAAAGVCVCLFLCVFL